MKNVSLPIHVLFFCLKSVLMFLRKYLKPSSGYTMHTSLRKEFLSASSIQGMAKKLASSAYGAVLGRLFFSVSFIIDIRQYPIISLFPVKDFI